MENYLNKSDCLKLETEELELLMGAEDSEVNLRYILTSASRRGSRIFASFITKEKSEHFVASKVRQDDRQRQRVQAQEERSQRSVRDDTDKGDSCWTQACEGIARRMVKYFEDSEVTKVNVRELEEEVMSRNESRIKIVRIARQARNEKRKIVSDFLTRSKRVLHR